MHILLFDIDGTLIHANGAGRRAIYLALVEAFGLAKPNLEIDFAGRTDLYIAQRIFEQNNIDPTPAHFQKLVSTYLTYLPSSLAQTGGQVLPGVIDLLEHLAEDDRFQLALITGNIEQGARQKLSHFDIDHYFAIGAFGDQDEHRADLARRAKALVHDQWSTGDPVESIIIIGDTVHDIHCARAIGAKCIAVETGFSPRDALQPLKPDALIKDLTLGLEAIQQLL